MGNVNAQQALGIDSMMVENFTEQSIFTKIVTFYTNYTIKIVFWVACSYMSTIRLYIIWIVFLIKKNVIYSYILFEILSRPGHCSFQFKYNFFTRCFINT